MIRLENLSSGYGKKQILDNISLKINDSCITTVIGPNGSGKSTLLKSVVGLCNIYSGDIIIDEKNIKELSKSERAQKIAYLSQEKNIPETTVQHLVLQGRFPYLSFPRKYSVSDIEKTKTAMQKMNILEYADTSLYKLSGGIRQKVYIAMALCQEADALLFDEPATYLDIKQQFNINDILFELKKNGKSVVCVIHDIITALKISDKIVVMYNGKIEITGTPKEILESEIIPKVFGVEIYKLENEYFYKQKGIF